ncbi:MAG: HDOD domain-containing protein [Acidimicrobiales bacterium]|nr:HDOD domain-containing protein [Acidimicrobiales bacterium]
MTSSTERTTASARPTAPALFEAAYDAVSDDRVCGPLAVGIRAYAVEVACLARELAPLVDAPQGEAFAAGLLHDLGELLLLAHDPTGYPELLTARLPHDQQLRSEKGRYGTDHALLGAEHLLDHRIAHVVADAVADHHDPFGGFDPVTIVVAAADELVRGDAACRHAVGMLDGDIAAPEILRDR